LSTVKPLPYADVGLHMPSPAAVDSRKTVPLCVDLDGTLIKTDLLWESLVRLLKSNPFLLFLVPFWWARGRACLKARIAERATVDPAGLPYNQALLDFLRSEKQQGREIILVTASDTKLAALVARHLGLFNEVMASDGKTNLRGKTKGDTLASRFGGKGFDYAGNSSVDLPVWSQAREAIVVNAASSLADRARQRCAVRQVFERDASWFKAFVMALRPHQWVKNLIIFVPLVTSHKLGEVRLTLAAVLAFVSFSFSASGVYILNDLIDLEADRQHPSKQRRPFASGDTPLPAGLIACPLLLACGLVLAASISSGFALVLILYLVLTTSYSLRLKQIALLDVFCLAGLYTIRLIAGHEATHIDYSFWLLVFSMFIFLSLALVKRFVELKEARQSAREEIKGRGYSLDDLELVASLGSSCGFMAVLVLALYANSKEVNDLYKRPMILLLVCPLLLYWISRVWLTAHRGKMHDDPIVFALKDPASYVVGGLTLAVLWIAAGHA
jgi:4-hydroxybenzoate polyprenyltransferase/phosphoserine phosphatase